MPAALSLIFGVHVNLENLRLQGNFESPGQVWELSGETVKKLATFYKWTESGTAVYNEARRTRIGTAMLNNVAGMQRKPPPN